jgi:CheY-like chemotaxis protein
LDINKPFIVRRKHTLAVDVADGVFVHGDPTRLAQIVGNLLHNAAKFTPEGGRIAVELLRDGDEVIVNVIDSGEGIVPEDIDHAFEMFARIDHTRGEHGLGIGLALGRRLAELHGGTLTASSCGPGQGSTFSLRLPALEMTHQPASSPASRAQEQPIAAMDIVVIEDSPDVATTLTNWLESMGHRVSVAQSGQAGLDLVATKRPSLVLCDLGLPEMDGFEVCRRVRRLGLKRQPVMVAITGWGREADRRRTSEAGFDQHLVKPVAAEHLRHVLRGVSNSAH